MGKNPISRYLADTHSLLWHLSHDPRLSPSARSILEAADTGKTRIFISAITLVESTYLVEKRSVPLELVQRIFDMLRTSKTHVLLPVNLPVAWALAKVERSRVPDMPDRIIAATALHYRLPVITKDSKLTNLTTIRTIW